MENEKDGTVIVVHPYFWPLSPDTLWLITPDPNSNKTDPGDKMDINSA